ncbi:MAG: hypothetical protein AAF363_18365 [Bacteroidota bacterium]
MLEVKNKKILLDLSCFENNPEGQLSVLRKTIVEAIELLSLTNDNGLDDAALETVHSLFLFLKCIQPTISEYDKIVEELEDIKGKAGMAKYELNRLF